MLPVSFDRPGKLPADDLLAAVNELGGSPYSPVSETHFKMLTKDVKFLKEVQKLMSRLGVEAPTAERTAREILAPSFFGVEEWIGCLKAALTTEQVSHIPEFPWDKDVVNSEDNFGDPETTTQKHFCFLTIDQFRRVSGQRVQVSPVSWGSILHQASSPIHVSFKYLGKYAQTAPEISGRESYPLRWHLGKCVSFKQLSNHLASVLSKSPNPNYRVANIQEAMAYAIMNPNIGDMRIVTATSSAPQASDAYYLSIAKLDSLDVDLFNEPIDTLDHKIEQCPAEYHVLFLRN